MSRTHSLPLESRYVVGVSAVGRCHCTFFVLVCQKYTRFCASFASDQPSGMGASTPPAHRTQLRSGASFVLPMFSQASSAFVYVLLRREAQLIWAHSSQGVGLPRP